MATLSAREDDAAAVRGKTTAQSSVERHINIGGLRMHHGSDDWTLPREPMTTSNDETEVEQTVRENEQLAAQWRELRLRNEILRDLISGEIAFTFERLQLETLRSRRHRVYFWTYQHAGRYMGDSAKY